MSHGRQQTSLSRQLQEAKRRTHRVGITLASQQDYRNRALLIISVTAEQMKCTRVHIFWWPNMHAEIENAKVYPACLDA